MKVRLSTNGVSCRTFPVGKGESVRFSSIQKAINYCNENDLEVVNKEEIHAFYSNQLKK
jgi:hypothetical protein|tara:strand:- start:150 stop:326 length:177 start_codon:yes stop_codon:yes gene_type:complete